MGSLSQPIRSILFLFRPEMSNILPFTEKILPQPLEEDITRQETHTIYTVDNYTEHERIKKQEASKQVRIVL